MRDLARRLLAVEAASPSATGAHVHEAVRVCEKLQISLTRFAGSDGFTSLLRRALALARAEVPAAHRLTVRADCSMEGLEDLTAGAMKSGGEADGGSGGDDGAEAVAAITAHLLELLVTFIGQPLTLRLVRESWPDASLDE